MLYMTLDEIEMRFTEAKDKKEQVGILADLNDKETTFMALLLREMGLDVPAVKMPRAPRNGGTDAYELFQLTPEYHDAVKYRNERGRTIGKTIGENAKTTGSAVKPKTVAKQNDETNDVGEEKKVRDTRLGDEMRLAIYMWGAYMEYTYGQTITRADIEMLERIIECTAGGAERVDG